MWKIERKRGEREAERNRRRIGRNESSDRRDNGGRRGLLEEATSSTCPPLLPC